MEIIPWYCSNIYDETNYVHPTSSHAHLYKQTGMYFGLPIYVSIKKKGIKITLRSEKSWILALVFWHKFLGSFD